MDTETTDKVRKAIKIFLESLGACGDVTARMVFPAVIATDCGITKEKLKNDKTLKTAVVEIAGAEVQKMIELQSKNSDKDTVKEPVPNESKDSPKSDKIRTGDESQKRGAKKRGASRDDTPPAKKRARVETSDSRKQERPTPSTKTKDNTKEEKLGYVGKVATKDPSEHRKGGDAVRDSLRKCAQLMKLGPTVYRNLDKADQKIANAQLRQRIIDKAINAGVIPAGTDKLPSSSEMQRYVRVREKEKEMDGVDLESLLKAVQTDGPRPKRRAAMQSYDTAKGASSSKQQEEDSSDVESESEEDSEEDVESESDAESESESES
eukprot:Lankesteria_metandrocarpae@DN1254_c0_g1_i1.p1